MKIKQIKLTNIGPYINENKFDFDLSDSIRRMILVGGKNGAGKTTLFKAIKTCLYGCVAYGYEAINAKYYAEVEKIINANEKLKKVGEAGVTIDLVLDDGKYDTTYTFVRQWRVAGKRITETFDVYREGTLLDLTEGYNGADVDYLCEKAKAIAINQLISGERQEQVLRMQDFVLAQKQMRSSVRIEDIERLRTWNKIETF